MIFEVFLYLDDTIDNNDDNVQEVLSESYKIYNSAPGNTFDFLHYQPAVCNF